MDSPLVQATIQSAALNALSNTLAQLITCWQSNIPYTIDVRNLLAFVTFSLIASPPNYLWQTWLEASFPGYSSESLILQEQEKLADQVVAGPAATEIISSGSATNRNGGVIKQKAMTQSSAPERPTQTKKKLSIRNTAAKFFLDQTLGAAGNTVLFIVGIALLQGRSFEQGIQECREGFWPLIRAGQRLWPLVSIINLTFVPVERRMVFGSIVGVGWGIFLSILSGGKKTKMS